MSRTPTMQERALDSLEKRKREYEKYFKTNPEIDNPTQSAYSGIIKLIVELSLKLKSVGSSTEDHEQLTREILRDDYGIES